MMKIAMWEGENGRESGAGKTWLASGISRSMAVFRGVALAATLSLVATLPSMLLAQPGSGSDPAFTARNLTEINSERDDYAPVATPNGEWLYFTSSRRGPSDFFRVPLEADGVEPTPLEGSDVNAPTPGGILNLPAPEEGLLNASGRKTGSDARGPITGVMASSREDRTNTDLLVFTVSPDGTRFDEVRKLEGLNSRQWDSQPAIASDGSFIIFSSTRKGGRGGKDLWFSSREPGGSYGAPFNLGEVVNSGDDEITPFIAADNRTVFFASDGHDGHGGFDIFMTRLDPVEGTWSIPENLGTRINSDANELFFYSFNRDKCWFVSDRDGGLGGLDLWEGSYNPFMPGYAKVTFSMIDTTTGRPLAGRLSIVEEREGIEVTTMEIDGSTGEGATSLYAEYPYTVTAWGVGFAEPQRITLNDLPESGSREITFRFGSEPPVPPPPLPPLAPAPPPAPPPRVAIDFEGIDVPLFVSGYYRLNTLVLLEELRRRQQDGGDLRSQGYIENVADDETAYEGYRAMALEVESLLSDFYRRAISEYLPAFDKTRGPDEVLEISVYGYSDPRPVTGRFPESEAVTFESPDGKETVVKPNEALDNYKLAGLRAYYAVDYLDRTFRDADTEGLYRKLLEEGAIRWRPISGNVDDFTGRDLADKRRIKVTVGMGKRDGR